MKSKMDLVLLDPISEAHLYFKHPNFTETSYMSLIVKGKLDKEVFKQAFHEFQRKYPRFRSILVERREGLFYKIYRKPLKSYPEVEEIKLLDNNLSHRERILEYFSKKVLQDFDLFNEVALRIYICDLGDNYNAIVFMGHHVFIDGHGVATFLVKFFLVYYEKLYNRALDLNVLGLFSSRRQKPDSNISKVDILKALFSKKSLGLVIKLFSLNSARKFKLKYPEKRSRHLEKLVFPKDTQEKLRAFARLKGATVNDLLIAILFRALDSQFTKNRKKNLFTISAPVNLYGKLPMDETRANNITSLVYGSYKSHRQNIENLLRLIRESRKRQIAADIDMVQYYYLVLLVKFSQLFPFRLRLKLFKNIFHQPSTSMLSNLGILWPEIKKGRPTGKSMVLKFGDIELIDLDFNYPGVPSVGHGLASFTYQEKLYLILTFNGAFFTQKNISQFISRIKQEVEIIIKD